MKIFELYDANNAKSEDFDLKDDLIFYMNNQPDFYRKHYFPTMLKFKKCYDKGQNVSPRAFKGLVEKAYNMYTAEFPVQGLAEKIDKDIFEKVCSEIHSTELENIKDGQYDE